MSQILSELEQDVERPDKHKLLHCRICGKPLHPFKDDLSKHMTDHAKEENEALKLWLGRSDAETIQTPLKITKKRAMELAKDLVKAAGEIGKR